MWLVFAEPLSEVHYGGGCLWSLCLHYHRQPNRYLSTNTLWEYHIYFTGTAIVIWKSRCSESYPISVQFLKQNKNSGIIYLNVWVYKYMSIKMVSWIYITYFYTFSLFVFAFNHYFYFLKFIRPCLFFPEKVNIWTSFFL